VRSLRLSTVSTVFIYLVDKHICQNSVIDEHGERCLAQVHGVSKYTDTDMDMDNGHDRNMQIAALP
jgi:hypothetical protein